ncbi:MAG TPA: hypothetical protein VHW02_00500 [Rhizomicrobium sp.]|jgi:glucose-6-phosphate isomerase|nr:hypothetical protein [Rhizomicrobium sp.]
MTKESQPFTVSLDQALSGTGAPPKPTYDAALEKAQEALAWLHKSYDDKSLEILQMPAARDDLAKAEELAAKLKPDTTDIAIFGIGGSSLGGQALADLVPFGAKRQPRVWFFDNIDPYTYDHALKTFDMKTTRFVCISKSGGTAETLIQSLAAVDACEKAGVKNLKNHFAVITEPKPTALKKFAGDMGCATLDHPVGVGGRYSVLTVVGLLPALLMGLDAKAIREGAQAALQYELAGKNAADVPAASGAALHHALAQEGHLNETVLWCYADELKTFGPWWRQLWAESLGKDGKGSTPVSALGPVDQHSQLQLFLDGPGGALFTILTTDFKGKGPGAPDAAAKKYGLDYMVGKTIGDLAAAEARATGDVLSKRGRPVRRMHVPKLNEHAFGALMMHFMLETMLMGKLMGVDPFNQPAVEEGKVLARQYLSESK